MILEVFSNLNDSMILFYDSTSHTSYFSLLEFLHAPDFLFRVVFCSGRERDIQPEGTKAILEKLLSKRNRF